MGVYHQMGHDSANLLGDIRLSRYRGAVLSPVDFPEPKTVRVPRQYQRPGFECIFDPQLYYPRAAQRFLPDWQYYPQDVDTADLSSRGWWSQRVFALSTVCRRIGVNAVCSPAVAPRSYSAAYYDLVIDVAEELKAQLQTNGTEVIPTVIVHLRDLALSRNVLEVASIITRASSARIYLIFVADVEPRREIGQTDDLTGGMRLVRTVEDAGLRLLIGYTSSDMILWRAAGAANCATGKFFNLRRFTPSRWDPPAQGGGQLPYWFEESVLAFLREADILRLQAASKLSPASSENPLCGNILGRITAIPRSAWLAESWRQYMYWFQEAENRLRSNATTVDAMLNIAEQNWADLKTLGVLLEEPANDGRWVSRWRRAVADYAAIE